MISVATLTQESIMNTTVLTCGTKHLDLAAVTGQWIASTTLLVRAVGAALWKGLYAITKARILLEHGAPRAVRRL